MWSSAMVTARAGTAAALAALAAAAAVGVAAPAPAQAQAQAPPPSLAPSLQAPDVPGYALRPTPDGGYLLDEEAWRATIEPDGTVRFVDHTISLLRLGPLNFGRMLKGPQLARPSLEGALRGLMGKRPPPDPWAEMHAPISNYHADPRDACLPRDACYFVPVGTTGSAASVAVMLDLTDAYMRWMKQDPYRYAKSRFLAATFELRTKMSIDRRAVLLRASLGELPARLEALWADTSRAPVERRDLLWRLWDEAGDGDDGRTARAIIERFIRERLPRGSGDAFTAAELARFGAASQGAFAPYGPALVPARAPAAPAAP